MTFRTREVWDCARRSSDVISSVPMGRVLKLITEAEKWECPRCKKS
jgi:hypothetical protein